MGIGLDTRAPLEGGRPEEGLAGLLARIAASRPGSPRRILDDFFGEGALADSLASLVSGVDHVGRLAPFGLGVEEVRRILLGSVYHRGLRTFPSRILSRELSARLGRPVPLTVVEAHAAPGAAAIPGIEFFVAELADPSIDDLVRNGHGSHLALRLSPDARLEDVVDALAAHSWAGAVGPQANADAGISLLYVDRRGGGRPGRLEFLATGA